MSREAGEQLPEPCGNFMHGVRNFPFPGYAADKHDPDCQTCAARAILAEHDHLHLGFRDREPCTVLGLHGVPGKMVKCKCGAYHH